MTDFQDSPPLDERAVAAQVALLQQLWRASIPLMLVLVLTAVRIAMGTYGTRGTTILLLGAVVAATTMFLYAYPTMLMAYGRARPRWTALASILGALPLLYGVYLGAIGGALGAFRAKSIGEAGVSMVFLISGFLYGREYSRLAMLVRAIETAFRRNERAGDA